MQAGQTFFSYSRNDAKFALKLAEDLRKQGADIWIDQIDIRPSEPWDEEIENALAASSCLLVILSHSSVASDNVLNEINYALETKKQVLPIIIEADIKKPFNIRRLQHIDLTGTYEDGLNQLLKTLNLGKPITVTKKASYKLAIWVAVVIGIIAVVVVLIQLNSKSGSQSNQERLSKVNTPVNVSGKWLTQELTNPFDENYKYKLIFDFEVLGDVVVGTINFVSTSSGREYNAKKGFLDGKIKDTIISFYTVEQSVLGQETVTFKDFYYGSISTEEIKFNLQSDRPWGFPGQKFVAKRSKE